MRFRLFVFMSRYSSRQKESKRIELLVWRSLCTLFSCHHKSYSSGQQESTKIRLLVWRSIASSCLFNLLVKKSQWKLRRLYKRFLFNIFSQSEWYNEEEIFDESSDEQRKFFFTETLWNREGTFQGICSNTHQSDNGHFEVNNQNFGQQKSTNFSQRSTNKRNHAEESNQSAHWRWVFHEISLGNLPCS